MPPQPHLQANPTINLYGSSLYKEVWHAIAEAYTTLGRTYRNVSGVEPSEFAGLQLQRLDT